jgi:hypothetical protein
MFPYEPNFNPQKQKTGHSNVYVRCDRAIHRVHIFTRDNQVSVSAHSAGAYTATLLVMVNVMKGGGRALSLG